MSVCLTPACRPARAPAPEHVNPTLVQAADKDPLALADALEKLIDTAKADEGDRRFAYEQVHGAALQTAATAFAVARITGRLAQVEGLAAKSLIAEVERAARKSISLDPGFRDGAATRLLASLYVKAPARLLEHGDSETGLEMLEELAEAHPNDVQTRLRLAEGYIALSDPEPSAEHLCFVWRHESELGHDDARLLEQLTQETKLNRAESCPSSVTPSP